ncbi:hypothetical protein [Leifsonia sp. NPDC077715]|uniref:hypothetical protein n=1 Tax=Leifsonia sp. NPDC077715 TaxID=3155539 RepID=UPI0034131C53
MKPEQFIREQGLDAVKDCIEEAKAYGGLYVNAKTLELSKHIPSYDAVSIIELMRLVESLDIITKVGGIHDVIEEHTKWMHAPELHEYRIGETVERLAQAIRDHESIYGGGGE